MMGYNDMLFTHNDTGGGDSNSYLVRPVWDHNIHTIFPCMLVNHNKVNVVKATNG